LSRAITHDSKQGGKERHRQPRRRLRDRHGHQADIPWLVVYGENRGTDAEKLWRIGELTLDVTERGAENLVPLADRGEEVGFKRDVECSCEQQTAVNGKQVGGATGAELDGEPGCVGHLEARIDE